MSWTLTNAQHSKLRRAMSAVKSEKGNMEIQILIDKIVSHIEAIPVEEEDEKTLDYKMYCLDAVISLTRAKEGFNYLTGKRR